MRQLPREGTAAAARGTVRWRSSHPIAEKGGKHEQLRCVRAAAHRNSAILRRVRVAVQ
jgi:hypothetical protein